MRRVACIITATLACGAAIGQGLLDCIDPDVLRGLLLQGQGERPTAFTAALPPELAPLKMPGGFTWIGSAERITGRADATTNTSQVTAAWRSSLAPDAARTAVAAAMTGSGWEVRPRMGLNVFNSQSTTIAQSACRDGKPVSMNVAAMDGVTYVMFNIQRGNNNSACNSPFPLSAATNSLERYMPRLELPVNPATGVAARLGSSGSGSSNGSANARVEFSAKDSPGNIARHFAKQMAEQGWSSDASWNGTSTAGSSWSRRGEAGALIQSTLTVTAVEEQRFAAVLRVLTLR